MYLQHMLSGGWMYILYCTKYDPGLRGNEVFGGQGRRRAGMAGVQSVGFCYERLAVNAAFLAQYFVLDPM
jgi:hypothetical protein